jgi:signal transduction histidine kinase
MSTEQLIQYLTWGIYILIFIGVVVHAIRRPIRANLDIALLFSLPTLIIADSILISVGVLERGPVISAIPVVLLLGMAYMLLRLVDDFSDVPVWLMRGAEAALVALGGASLLFAPNQPVLLSLLEVAYLLTLLVYSVVAFLRESVRSNGVTMRRMRAVAAGSIALCVLFAIAGLGLVFPELRRWSAPLTNLAGLASAVCYFIGFAPPSILRRAWQEPELRAFLSRAATLPRLPDTHSIIREIERGAAQSLGAANASIGLWDEEAGVLRFSGDWGQMDHAPTIRTTAGRAFLDQRPAFTPEVRPDNPLYSRAEYAHAKAVMAAPITAGTRRLGVLTVYSPRTPIFAEEDLELVKLLADQAAVVLESRALIDEAARVRAREEVARMKEDFLSAAAHDLKTPLTTIVAQVDLLERRALRNPDAPADLTSLTRLKKEVNRLKTLVLELLDAARTEQGRLVSDLEEVDLVSLARAVCERHSTARHPCTVIADGSVVGMYDPTRISQLIENLVENAIKYSPEGGPVQVRVWAEGNWNHMTVTDRGIGIPEEDLPNVFERFHRGKNVDDRRFAGMGLGLFICRGIVEQHGGRIWVERPGVAGSHAPGDRGSVGGRNYESDAPGPALAGTGTTFHAALPASPPPGADTGATPEG